MQRDCWEQGAATWEGEPCGGETERGRQSAPLSPFGLKDRLGVSSLSHSELAPGSRGCRARRFFGQPLKAAVGSPPLRETPLLRI